MSSFPSPARRRRRAGLAVAAALLFGGSIAATAALAQSGGSLRKLFFDGTIASKRVRMIDGEPYVPLNDLKRSLNGELTLESGTGIYRLTTARGAGGAGGASLARDGATAPGGSQQVQAGTTGRVGQDLFDGKTRFKVVSVQEMPTYAERFNQEPRTYEPAGPNEKLIVVTCQIKNGTGKKRAYSTAYFEPNHTALADMDGRAYQPIGWDMRLDGGRFGGAFASPEVLPSAAIDLALVFSVPRDARLKDVIFSASPAQGESAPSDFRVSVATP